MNLEAPSQIQSLMTDLGRRARAAGAVIALAPAEAKNKALRVAAQTVRARAAQIQEANARDMAASVEDMSKAMLDRLLLDAKRIEAMAKSLEEIAELPDPVGQEMARWSRPNGLDIARVRTPLGVIGIIYESRPNVTADAGGLCLKAGNAAILRGGKESLGSSAAILACLHEGLVAAGLPPDALQMVPTPDRAAVGVMLRMNEYIDVIVPRGGKSLIERVIAESRIPLFQHLEGNCHTYVDGAAEPGDGAQDRAQCQDAAHGRLRRHRDAAGGPLRGRNPSPGTGAGPDRCRLRGARRRIRARCGRRGEARQRRRLVHRISSTRSSR